MPSNSNAWCSPRPIGAEARYHRRKGQSLQVQRGLVKQAKSAITAGVGIRVLVDGAWGFSSTSETAPEALEKALKRAIECAKSISQMKKSSVKALAPVGLARGEFRLPGLRPRSPACRSSKNWTRY